MGLAPEKQTGRPEASREAKEQTREADGSTGKLQQDTSAAKDQREVRKIEDERVRKSLEKTQHDLPPADQLLAMLQSGNKTGQDIKGVKSDAAAAPADAKTVASGSDKSQEVKESQTANAVQPVDKQRISAASDAVWKGTNQDSYVRSADSKGILDTLRDNTKTESERKYLQADYAAKHGQTMEEGLKKTLSDSDFKRAQDYLNGKAHGDGRDVSDAAANLKEMNQWTGSRSSAQVETDLKEMVASKTPAELKKLDADFKQENKDGKSFRQAIADDPNLSRQTKETIAVYMDSTRDAQGKLSSDDVQKLAGVALKYGDSSSLTSALSGASPEARQRFLAEGGKEKMQEMMKDPVERKVFPKGSPGQDRKWSSDEYMHALEIAQNGEMSTATKIRDNTGRVSNNDKAMDTALQDMKPEERKLYAQGKEMAASGKVVENPLQDMKPEERKLYWEGKEMVASGKVDESSKAYKTYQDINPAVKAYEAQKTYQDINAAIDDSTRFEAERTKRRDQVAYPGGSAVSEVVKNNAGTISHDGAEKIGKTLSNLSEKDFDLYKKNPQNQNELRTMLKDTMKLSDGEVAQVTKSLDQSKDYQDYRKSAQTDQKSEHVPIGRQVAEKGEAVWDNKQEFLRDFLKEPLEKRQELLKSSLGEKITDPLNEDQKQVFERLANSPTANPADLVRAHVVGLGIGKEDLADRLSKLSSEQKEQLKSDYAAAYKTDAMTDLVGSRTGIEREKWVNALKRPAESTDEAMFDIRKQGVQSRVTEVGLVDNWDGTRRMAEARGHEIRNEYVEGKASGAINPQTEAQNLSKMQAEGEKLFADRERVVESRKDVANAAVTGVTTVVGLGAAGMTVRGLMAGGALLKAGTHEAVVGSDGDTSAMGRASNLVTGAAEAGLLKFAPGAGNPEAGFLKTAAGNVLAAEASTLPGIVVDSARNWDSNKSRTENVTEAARAGVINMATAGGTALGFSVGGAILNRVSRLRGEVPNVHASSAAAEQGAVGAQRQAITESLDNLKAPKGALSPQDALHGVPGEVSPPRFREAARVPASEMPPLPEKVIYKGDGQEYSVVQRLSKNEVILSGNERYAGKAPQPISVNADKLADSYTSFDMAGKTRYRNNQGQVFELTSTVDLKHGRAISPEQLQDSFHKVQFEDKTFYRSGHNKLYELSPAPDGSGVKLYPSSGPELHADPNLRYATTNRLSIAPETVVDGTGMKVTAPATDLPSAPASRIEAVADMPPPAPSRVVAESAEVPMVKPPEAKSPILNQANLERRVEQYSRESNLLNRYAHSFKEGNEVAQRKLEAEMREAGLGKLVLKDNHTGKDIKRLETEAFHRWWKSNWANDNLQAVKQGVPSAKMPEAPDVRPSGVQRAHYQKPSTDLDEALQAKVKPGKQPATEALHEGSLPENASLQAKVKPGKQPVTEALHEGSLPENVSRRIQSASDTPEVKPSAAAAADSAKKVADLQEKGQRFDEQGALLMQYAQALKNETAKGPEARQKIEELLREKGLKKLIVSQNNGERTAKQILNQAQNKWRLADWAKQAVKQFEQDSI